jgi:hypothetical protein
MIANLCLLALYLTLLLYGSVASLLTGNRTFTYDEIQKRFFVGRSNFDRLMKGLSELSDRIFGQNIAVKFIKINLLLLFFFLMAFAWYSIAFTDLRFLVQFFRRGLTIDLGENERNYFLQNWPWHYVDLTRNSGKELYIGDQYIEAVLLVLILFVVLSASSSLSILNTMALIRKLHTKRVRLLPDLLRMAGSFCVSVFIDASCLVLFLTALIVGGHAVNVSLQEVFKASATQHWLEYGYGIAVGNHRVGHAAAGLGIIVPNIDFDEFSRSSDPAPHWVHWIFSSPQFEDDAGLFCLHYDMGGTECADQLRSMYFKHFFELDGWIGFPRQIAEHLYTQGVSIACGNNPWSQLAKESGAREGISLELPLVAALAVMLLSRFLIMPCLALILFFDYILVKLGRYAALSSEKGLTLLMRHGPALLVTSPIIAITLLASFVRRLC